MNSKLAIISSVALILFSITTSAATKKTARIEKVNQIIKFVESKLSKVKSYTAEVERKVLDPNGGFNTSIENHMMSRINRLLIKGKTTEAHNSSDVGKTFVTMINDGYSYGQVDNEEINKTSFEKWEEYGVSLRMYMAYLGNLTDPFFIYEMKTIKLEKETDKEWVLSAKYKKIPKLPHWLPQWTNLITIDKKTGIIKKLEVTEPGEDIYPILKVNKIFTSTNQIPESKFKMKK